MREWLADLEALRPHADPNTPAAGAFTTAYTMAWTKAEKAVAEYTAELAKLSP
jgi:hypothetical protein